MYGLTPYRVRYAEHRSFENRRVAIDRVLDFRAVHVLGTGHDHVLGSVNKEHVALVVLVAEVAGSVPPIHERGRSFLRLVPISGHHVRAADDDFADLTDDRRRAAVCEHRDIDTDSRLAA